MPAAPALQLTDSDVMSVADAAHALGVRYNAALNMVFTHRLDGQRIGTRWYVTRASVARFLAGKAPVGGSVGRPRKSA